MLDSDHSKFLATGGHRESITEDAASFSLADFKAALRRQALILTIFACIGLAGGAAFIVFFKPNFQATATVLIDTRKYPDTPQAEIAARTTYDSSAAIDTQVEILKSQILAQSAIDKLAAWREPEFVATGAGPRAMIAKFLRLNSTTATLSAEELRNRAIAHFLRHLSVKRVADTFAIDITFESAYADEAAKVANVTAAAFIDWQRELHRAALASAGDWLEGRIKDLEEKSKIGQQSVADYQGKNNILGSGGGSADEKRLNELSNQLEAVRAKATDAQVKLIQLNQVSGDKEKRLSDLEIVSAIENADSEPSITALRLQYMELNAKYGQLSKLLPTNHQALVDLRNQQQNFRVTLLGELSHVQLMVKSNLDAAQEKIKDLQNQIEAVIKESRASATAQVALKQLELNAQTYQNLYDSFLHRYAVALQGDQAPAAVATIISQAEPPPMRNYKKALIISALFPALGLLCGGAIAFHRERVSRPFWTSGDVERELGLSCSDAVPQLKPRELKRAQETYLHHMRAANCDTRIRDPIGYYALAKPLSRFAESLRSIRIALKIGKFEGERRAVGVTSALPNEGKSSISLALAASSAKSGVRTLLVDCDLRNSTLTKSWLGSARRVGLVDVLSGAAALQDALQLDEETQLHFLPCGLVNARSRVGDLMTSDGLATLICDLKDQYDLVIVDLPPMSPVIDVAISQNFIDGYLIVIEWGQTKIASVNYALHKMPQVYEGAVSVVLNKVDIKRMGKFGFDIRSYYSNKYADRYIAT